MRRDCRFNDKLTDIPSLCLTRTLEPFSPYYQQFSSAFDLPPSLLVVLFAVALDGILLSFLISEKKLKQILNDD